MVIIMKTKERELLEKILNTGWLDHELSCEAQELLAQPEQNKPAAIMPNGVCVSNVYDAYEEGRKSLMSEQEPVAWMWKKHTAGGWLDVVSIDKPTANAHQINIRPLYYTAPQKREPLTDENVCEILLKKEWKGFVDLVRIIEKEHGIGGGK